MVTLRWGWLAVAAVVVARVAGPGGVSWGFEGEGWIGEEGSVGCGRGGGARCG